MIPERMHMGEHFKSRFKINAECFKLYRDVKEEVLVDATTFYRKDMEFNAWVDIDHSGDRLTQRSHTFLQVLLNSIPIVLYLGGPLIIFYRI